MAFDRSAHVGCLAFALAFGLALLEGIHALRATASGALAAGAPAPAASARRRWPAVPSSARPPALRRTPGGDRGSAGGAYLTRRPEPRRRLRRRARQRAASSTAGWAALGLAAAGRNPRVGRNGGRS